MLARRQYGHLIEIEHRSDEDEKWKPFKKKLAMINRTGGAESYANGAEQIHNRMNFEIRYDPDLFDIFSNPGQYRIIYRNHVFNIVSYDDYFEDHETIKLVGESYG